MILKIRIDGGWTIFDGIEKCNFKYPNKSPWRINEENGNVEMLCGSDNSEWRSVTNVEYHPSGSHHAVRSKDGFLTPYYATIFRRLSDGVTESFTILFDEGYLMNESGKTIERMHP